MQRSDPRGVNASHARVHLCSGDFQLMYKVCGQRTAEVMLKKYKTFFTSVFLATFFVGYATVVWHLVNRRGLLPHHEGRLHCEPKADRGSQGHLGVRTP